MAGDWLKHGDRFLIHGGRFSKVTVCFARGRGALKAGIYVKERAMTDYLFSTVMAITFYSKLGLKNLLDKQIDQEF